MKPRAEPDQRLRQSFEQRYIGPDQNHFCHCELSLVSGVDANARRRGKKTKQGAHINLNSIDSVRLRRKYARIGVKSSPPKLGTIRRMGASIGSLNK